MKMRIKGDSVRLRLTKSEVRQIDEGRAIRETTHFPGGTQLHYLLETSPNLKGIEAEFSDHQLRLKVPEDMAQTWANSETVEMRSELPLPGSDNKLVILIEKDFFCLKPRSEAEDESDMFVNPNSSTGCCG